MPATFRKGRARASHERPLALRSTSERLLADTLSLSGPVARARSANPIPSRTRPLNSEAPMVLCLKTRESRSPPGQTRTDHGEASSHPSSRRHGMRPCAWPQAGARGATPGAGWSSPVARQAHNLKVVSSNLAPATHTTTIHDAKRPVGENRRGVRLWVSVVLRPRP